ncbi:MAG: 4Fe-4S dicluster domain-containing protein [Ignavibacteria bacterium]
MNNTQDERNRKDPGYPGNNPEVNETDTDGVTGSFDITELSGISRRKFLALLSASTAFAVASCSNYRDKGEIVSYNKKPEEVIPGVANFYASTCTGCHNTCGILIKTREGRPVKVDGNPEHPVNKGKICATGQAGVLNLYDPNRLKNPVRISDGISSKAAWSKADDVIISAMNSTQNSGKHIAVLTHSIQSPGTLKVYNEFKTKYPNARFYSYEVFNEANRNSAWKKSYDSSIVPLIKWDEAEIILSFEGDFLSGEGHSIETIRMFASKRDAFNKVEFSRFYQAEGSMSATGINSDYRFRLRPDQQQEFALALLSELNKKLNNSLSVSNGISLAQAVKKYNLSEKNVNRLVTDLYEKRGRAIVYAGSRLPESMHLIVNALNEVLGNTKLYNQEQFPVSSAQLSTPQEIDELVKNMRDGNVGVLIHVDTNPVYHFPPEYNYAEALKKVPLALSLTEQENETSSVCAYSLPLNHNLESWGDYNTRTGVYSLQQPVINPLYKTRQKEAVFLVWSSGNKNAWKETVYHEYLLNSWEKDIFPKLNSPLEFKTFWFTALENGVVLTSADNQAALPRFKKESLASLAKLNAPDGFVMLFKQNHYLGDGRFANNGWLQELPHPVSKVVWDNYAAVSPATGKELGVKNNDKIEVTINGRRQQLPVFLQPGMADKMIAVELGYGRSKAGDVGTDVGVNVNTLLGKFSDMGIYLYSDVKVQKVKGSYKLVSTQEQHSLDELLVKDLHLTRGIIRQGTYNEFKKNPDFLEKDKREQPTIIKEIEYKGVKWGMGIDLNKCIGCNVCVAGCDVENNIPVVGKDQVDAGRVMQWVRVDRYYSGTPEEPVVYTQPMLCQHCDTAPCENVCPVAATSHSPDGLNQMTYNRCVGTRYCSNNCPYKVRRFNFFNFRDHFADGYYQQEPVELAFNPEVTVRSRGVMEKCTFCIQRIMESRAVAIKENRPLKGSDVQTACQQACPSKAIEFGDVNDPESVVSKYRTHELGYHVLADINTRPNVTYLAKLRNTFPEDKE